MIVVGWNNGKPNNETGAGYGISVKKKIETDIFKKVGIQSPLNLIVEVQYKSIFQILFGKNVLN